MKRLLLHENAAAFLAAFFATAVIAFAATAATIAYLRQADLAPPPPLVGTHCIDEKLLFLRRTDLSDRNLISVGSSATWRNLDLEEIKRIAPDIFPLNAAPCYIYVHQTNFFLSQLLKAAPNIQTVLVVFHIRDFATCEPSDRMFANPPYMLAYLRRHFPEWVPYATGFRPRYFARRILAKYKARKTTPQSRDDAYGGSVLTRPNDWNPSPHIDERCLPEISTLADIATKNQLRLVVATVPPRPSWMIEFDPDGALQAAWIDHLKSGLTAPNIIFVDGRSFNASDEHFADPVHLMAPYHIDYSRFIAEAIRGSIPPDVPIARASADSAL